MYNFFMKIILASASPRRKEILLKAGYDFEIVPSCYDENISGLTYSNELVENCAYQKALDVKKRVNADLPIVSADTVVVLDDLILGKPKNCFEAFNMLKQLSLSAKWGYTHYTDRDVIGTDLEEITGNKKMDLYALLRWKF